MINSNHRNKFRLNFTLAILLWFIPIISSAQIQDKTTSLEPPPTPSLEDSLGRVNYEAILKTINGEVIPFDSLKGKVIFAHIWATTCSPCIPELPSLQRLYEALPTDSVAFLMISLDDSTKLVKDFLENRNLDLPVQFMHYDWAFANVALGSPIQIIMPSTYIIGRKGNIRYKHIGAAKWDSPELLNFITSLASEQ